MTNELFIFTEGKFVPVPGKPVSLPGYADYAFFIHRPVGIWQGADLWEITEARTGLAVLNAPEKTETAAIEKAINNINRHGGKSKLDDIIKKARKSPCYDKGGDNDNESSTYPMPQVLV